MLESLSLLLCYHSDFRVVLLGQLEPVAEDFVVGLVVRRELVNVTAVVTPQCSGALVARGRARRSHSREVEELAHRVNDASWNLVRFGQNF